MKSSGSSSSSATPGASYPFSTRMHGVQSSMIRDLLKFAQRPGIISLAGGLPSPFTFDVEGIQQATHEVLAHQPARALQYGLTDGQPTLKHELTRLTASRGAASLEDNLVVTTGSQQGIDLMARLLVNPGDVVVVERPAYLAALQTFALAQASLRSIDSDANGACVEQIDEVLDAAAAAGQPVKLIYVVANFANPSGATLSRERRLHLLQTAVARQVFVLEDDPYGELRSFGASVPPLIALASEVPDAVHWCGYLSTLSKIVAPGFRLGWLVLPPAVHEQAVICKQGMDLHSSTFAQEIAAKYLASGRLQARLPSIRAAYRERNEALAAALDRHLGSRIVYNRPEGGMFVWARLNDDVDASEVLRHAIEEGMIFVPGSAFYADAPDRSTLRLSFATPAPDELDTAVQRLVRALDKSLGRLKGNFT
ncbi:MAG TPA: PLP-dependent aminotransferase family protein [Burkholderiaceae bacterium]